MSRVPSPTSDADEALREWAEQPVPPMNAGDARDLRARVVARMDAARAEHESSRAARARRVRVFGWAAAACGVLATGLGLWRAHATATAERVVVDGIVAASEVGADGVAHALVGSAPFGPDDELRTATDGSALVSLPSGARVVVGPTSRLRFDGRASDGHVRDQIDLVTGRIGVTVPKLAAGDEVRVHTDGATVIVHGTKFSVERTAAAPGQPARTTVAVTEGRVAVRTDLGEVMLTPGQSWSEPSPGAASTLAAENALLADALRLERDHHPDDALARIDELLKLYPASPLAETAREERTRILEVIGPKARTDPRSHP
jgi:hypothetical protein